jgi:predicted AlkP superfamily phosphohydrolase/phosphomutase
MIKHIKAALVFWTLAVFILIELAVLSSRLYVSPTNFWKLLIGALVFYNLFGLILAVLSSLIDKVITRPSSEGGKKFQAWIFGGVHGSAVMFLSLFYWLNKVVQSDIWLFSFNGLIANFALLLGGFIVGVLVVTILSKLPKTMWKWVLAGFLLAFIVANYSMYHKVKAFQNKEVVHMDDERRDTGLKVLLLGVDGATWDVLDPLIEAGEVPNFARLVNEGFSDRFRTILPTSSPIIWTSIATGKKASKHGVSNVVFTVIPGMGNSIVHFSHLLGAKTISQTLMDWGVFHSVPVSSTIRQSKAIWNINTDYGLTTDVVAWWGTWPPDSIKGAIVSDLASTYKQDLRIAKGQLTATGDFDYQKTARTYPPMLEADLLPFQDSCSALSLEEANRFLEVDSTLLEEINTAKKWERFDWRVCIRYSYLVDKFNKMAGQYLMEKDDWDCVMLYFNMIDAIEHYFWMYYDEESFKDHKIYGDLPLQNVVPNAYKIMDSMIGDVLEKVDENTVVILVSDHGFETYIRNDNWPVCDHTHAPDGIFIAAGPHIAHKKQRTSQYSIYDVTPTMLTLLGIPLGEDMDGEVMTDIFEEGFQDAYPFQYVDSHDAGFKWRSRTSESEVDTHMLEKFRALGYIQ